jgi:hypothetical protein
MEVAALWTVAASVQAAEIFPTLSLSLTLCAVSSVCEDPLSGEILLELCKGGCLISG